MRNPLRWAPALLLVLTATGCAASSSARPRDAATADRAATPHTASPGPATTRAGFSVERLARIDSTFERLIESREMAGAVALVLRDGQTVYERAFGWADLASRRPMSTDAIFRIASQTKALTSVAIMMLAEEGRLSLNDRASRFIPSFERTRVAVQTDSGPALVDARRQITIRDLLTHTAGISYGVDPLVASLYVEAGLGSAAGFGWYTADKAEPMCETMDRLGSLPFVAQPGERWVYGYATDVLGCIVERASGLPLDRFIESRITLPLRMRDTHFYLPAGKLARLATVYTRGAGDSLAAAPEGARGQGHYAAGPRASFSGGAGLVSTAHDYARFLQMLLDGGELDGVRILAPKTVSLMTVNHVGSLFPADGQGFGLGFRILERAGAGGRTESVGTFDWGGAYGSSYLVDPEQRIVMVFLVQELPNVSAVAQRFPMLVYQALIDPRE